MELIKIVDLNWRKIFLSPYFYSFLIYALFLGIFSYLYPYGLDEMKYFETSFIDAFQNYVHHYNTENSRIGLLINNFILVLGKPSFIFLNIIVQITAVCAMFFLIFGRKPNFKTISDFYPLNALILLYTFATCGMSDVFFWIGGACNYSWVFTAILILFCFLRRSLDGKIIKTNFISNILFFILGIICGMSNENNGPFVLGTLVLFFILCKIFKKKVPTYFYFVLAGICFGLYFLFSAKGPYIRLSNWRHEVFRELSIFEKVFIHLYLFNDVIVYNLFLPVINFFLIIFVLLKKGLKIFRNKNFLFANFFFWGACVLGIVLSVAPLLPYRAFFSVSVFMIISFFFILQLLGIRNIFKFIFALILCFALAVLPTFSVPFVYLFKQDKQRTILIEKAKREGKKIVQIPNFIVLNGPTENMSIGFYDICNVPNKKLYEKFYKIDLLPLTKFNDFTPASRNI